MNCLEYSICISLVPLWLYIFPVLINVKFPREYVRTFFWCILVDIVWVNSRGNFLGEFSWTKCPRKFLYLGEFSWTKNVHENSWKMSTRIHPLKISTRTPSFWKKVSTRIHFPRKFSIPCWSYYKVHKVFSGCLSSLVWKYLHLSVCNLIEKHDSFLLYWTHKTHAHYSKMNQLVGLDFEIGMPFYKAL